MAVTTPYVPWVVVLFLAMTRPALAGPVEHSLNLFVSSRDAARGYVVTVPDGMGVNISFRELGERVRRIWLDDISEVVIDVDEPLPSAQLLHLKRIVRLTIPNQTRAAGSRTLLTVVTDRELYQFVLVPVPTARSHTIHIIPEREPVLQLDEKTVARLSHVENGLNYAIKERRILPDSPLVLRVREFIARARTGLSIPQAAEQQGLYLSFLQSLARLGMRPVDPFPRPPAP
jgi:hypothetical protein